MEIILRLLFIIFLTLAAWSLLLILKQAQIKSAQAALSQNKNSVDALEVVYFWSTQCTQCRLSQKPALSKLSELSTKNKVLITDINIEDKPHEAIKWGVRTVPTTYILNANRELMFINNGLASTNKLLDQINSLKRKKI
jgi:thiol-disulfide isomerase/thioredoxin